MNDPIIARVRFNDGAVRPIFEGLDGRQYVQGGEVERVYGVWFIPPDGGIDLPCIVDSAKWTPQPPAVHPSVIGQVIVNRP